MAIELTEEKQRAVKTWDAGDFPHVAKLIASAGELCVERAKLGPDDRVIDVACGSGNATIPAARTGATVIGLDITPSLLEAGKREAAEAGVEIEWVEGDAENLPYGDDSFDAVISVFGVMFAPDHRKAAAEVARVLKPGGRMVLCNWDPDGEAGRFFKVIAEHMPPPPEGFQRRCYGEPRTTCPRCSRARECHRPSSARACPSISTHPRTARGSTSTSSGR